MGESVAVIINALESGALRHQGERMLIGDSLTGLKILQAPDGPWRTRHLRLRAFVIKERVQLKRRKTRHAPGAGLVADLLTKSIVNLNAWDAFFSFLGIHPGRKAESSELDSASTSPHIPKMIAALGCLVGLAVWTPVEPLAVLAITASVVCLAKEFKKKKEDPQKKKRAGRENEPPAQEKRSVREMNLQHWKGT